jgi:uncharacterized oxidoreductase
VHTSGHRILITGGGSGLGLALLRAFAAAGDNRLLICGRDGAKLARAAAEVPGTLTVVADVATAEGRAAALEAARERMGGLSLLVNNAGIQGNHDYAAGTPDHAALRAEIETNLVAPMLLTAEAMPLLHAATPAAIVNITSGLALIPKPSAPGYCAAKAGLRGFTRTLRAQLAGSGVAVFEVLPGQVQTETTWGTLPGPRFAEIVLAAIRADRAEILPGKMAPLALLERLSPALAAAVVRRMAKRSARMRAAATPAAAPGNPATRH